MKHIYSPLRRVLRALVLSLTLIIGATNLYAVEAEVEVVVPEPTVQVHHGKILINIPGQENVTISVFALTGQLLKQVTVTPGPTQLDLPAGFYIIRIGETVKRIAVS